MGFWVAVVKFLVKLPFPSPVTACGFFKYCQQIKRTSKLYRDDCSLNGRLFEFSWVLVSFLSLAGRPQLMNLRAEAPVFKPASLAPAQAISKTRLLKDLKGTLRRSSHLYQY